MRNRAMVLQKKTVIDWVAFERSLQKKFGVNAVTFKKGGDRKTHGDIGLANGICYLIKKHPGARSRICDVIQSHLNHEARTKNRYVADECAAGMYKIVVPVIKEDEIEGFVSTCGRPFVTSGRIFTNYIHEATDEDEERIEDLLPTLNPINPRTIKDMLNYITGYS